MVIFATTAVLFSGYTLVLSGAFISALVVVSDKTFTRERVQLSGFSYRHCTFVAVTFVIDGSSGSEIIDDRVVAPFSVTADSDIVNYAIQRLNGLGGLRMPYVVNGKVVPPFGDNSQF